jgi:glycosyltransferase involved in cell wall biosynthesis
MATTLIIRTLGQRPGLLRRAVASALAQRDANVEVIVVGDGANPAALLDGFVDSRLRLLAIPHQGRSAAGNAGLAAAGGELIGFLDDDDELLPDHVRLLTTALAEAPDAVAVYALAERLEVDGTGDEQRVRRRHIESYFPYSKAALWLHNLMPIQAVLFRAGLFRDHGGFDPALDALEDWDLWLRYAQAGPFIALPQVTSRYATPASRAARVARTVAHAPALQHLRLKHAELSATMNFTAIQALDDFFRHRHFDNALPRYSLRRIWRYLKRAL